jgi:hypothetical protein
LGAYRIPLETGLLISSGPILGGNKIPLALF